MASIALEIPKEIETRVIVGFCEQHGYQNEVVLDGTAVLVINPESKLDFMTRTLYEYITQGIKTTEAAKAAESARQADYADVESKVASVLVAPTVKLS